MAVGKSSLSAGALIYAVLTENAEISSRASKVYPVVEDTAELPYIVYRRAQLEKDPVKNGPGHDTVTIEIQSYTKDYT